MIPVAAARARQIPNPWHATVGAVLRLRYYLAYSRTGFEAGNVDVMQLRMEA